MTTLGNVYERLAKEGRLNSDGLLVGEITDLDLRGLIDAALAGDDDGEAPWYVHLFVGFGTWIGAVITAFFLEIIGLLDDAGEAVVLGVLLLVAATVTGRYWGASVLGTQLTWVLAIGGQAALLAAGVDLGEDLLLIAVLLQVVTFVAIPLPLLRGAVTVAAVASLAFWLVARDIPLVLDVLVVAVMVACLAIWLHETRICASRGAGLWRPLAFALPIGLATPLVLLTVLARWGWHEETVSYPLPVSLALGLLGFWILVVAVRESGQRPRPELLALCAVGLLVTVALTHEVPGVVAGFLLLALAHLRRDRWLEGLGLVQLALFLTLFYYSLNTPLLHKSLWIILTGGLFLVLAGVLRRLMDGEPADAAPFSTFSAARWPLILALFLALAIPTASILHKESILAKGRTVLLELRPVDPRSLIQGDFMVLAYAVEREFFELAGPGASGAPRSGRLVLELDADGVGRLAGVDRAAEVGELLLTYRIRKRSWGGHDLRLGAESFLFEEGSAELYSGAKYGELRIAPSGTAVLVGLRDVDRRPLGKRLHEAGGSHAPAR